MPGVNANKVEFIFNPLKYFSLGENFKINCKIDSTIQQHIVEVKVDNVSSKKTIEGLDVDIFPLEFVGEISAGNHSINVAIYEGNEVIGRMFYPCITVYDYNDYSIRYITDNNDKNPYISTYYIEPIVNINEEWEIEIFVDDFYCSGYRNLNIGDEKTYEIHVEIDDKHIVYDNLSHGNHFIKMPALSEYKVYDFVLYAKDNLGYESHVLLNEVWVKPEIEENIYQMTEDDLVTYGITNKKVENIVPIYCNEEEYNAIMAVAKNSRYLTRNEILSSKDEVVNYNIPSGEYVCFIPDFNNDGEYDPFEGWLYKEQYTRYAEDYNTEEIYNMAESNRIGLQQFIDDKIEEGYTTVKLIENGYFIVNDLTQLDSTNVEYHPGSIIIEGANNFTLDLNGSTIKMNANANASSKIVTLSKSFNSHVKNGIIDGDVFTHDYDNSTNNSEWNQIAGIHDDCRYCSFENLTMSHSSGYGYVGGGGGVLKNGDRMYTSYIILCPKFVYGDIDDNGNVIESNDRSISDFIDISTAISKYKSFYGEDIKYIRGQISKYLGYQGNGLCNWNLKVFMYDENKNLIHKRVGYQYREVDIPVNTKYIRVVALADYNFFDVGTGIRLVHFFRPINCVTKNVTIKEIRGTGGAWTGSSNCLFTDMEIRSVGNHVTPTAFDFEDGWDQMQDVTMRNIRCFGDGGGSTNLMTCGGHNFIYENIGHDSEAVAYNYGRTRHYVYRNCVSNNKFAQNYQSIIRTGTPRMYNCDIKTLSNSENPNIFINFKSDHIDRGTIYNSTVKNHIINNYSSIISTCDIINSNVICNGWSGYISRKAYFVNDRFICEDENKSIDIAINTGGNVIMYDCTFDSFTRFRDNSDLSLLYVENCSFPKGVAIEPNVIKKNFQKNIMFKKCNMTIDSLEYDFINSKPHAYSAGPIKVTFEDCVITIKNIGPNKSIWYDNSKSTEGVIKFINCKFIFETEDKIGLFTTSASNKLGRTNLLVKMIKCEMIDDITKTTVKNTEGIKYFETNTDEIIIDTNLPRLVYLNNEDVIIPYCSVSSNDGVIETHGVIRSLTDEEFNNINIDNYNVDQGYINDSISSNALPSGEYQYEVYAVDSYGLRSEPLTISLTINEYIEENDFTEIVVDIPTDNYELVLIGSSELIINTGEINWGDGTEDILTTDNLSHTYTTAGEYTIRGKFIFGKGIKPTNTIKNVLIKVNKLCSNYSLNLNNAFEGMNRLETFNCDNIRVDNLANTFNGCNALTSLDISNWNTDKVTNMYGMFKDCKLLTSLNLSNWDTSNVTDMSSMFHGCNSLATLDVSNWNTSKVTNMSSMFRDCTNLISLDVSNWNTDNVTNMSYMFQYNYVLTTLDVSNWNTSEVTSMNNMFYACRALTTLDVSNWNTSNVTNMSYMFNDCRALTTLDVSNFNTSKVTNMSEMFHNCTNLTSLDVSNFNTSKVTNIGGMFHTCQSLTSLDVSNFNTSNVTHMYMMFYNCKLLTSLDVSKWDISKVTNMVNMFINCTNLTSITMNNSDYNSVNKIIEQLPTRTSSSIGILRIAGVDDINQVDIATAESKFWNIETSILIARYTANASGVVPIFNEGYQYTVNETNSNGIYTVEIYSDVDFTSCSFYNKTNLLTVEYLKITNNVTNMASMFDGCSSLTSVGDLSNWDVGHVTDMCCMFQDCESLTSIGDLSNWDVGHVTDMSYMFYECESLTSLDLSNWDTSNVTDISNIFTNCYKLESLDLSRWDVTNLTTMYESFYECDSLKSVGDLSNWNVSKLTTTNSLFDKCWELTGVGDLSNWDTKNITDIGWMFRECHKLESNVFDSVSSWNVSSVTNMQSTFENCDNLIHLDLSNWDISNVTNMDYMFLDCQNLTELNISNWHLNSEISITDIFENTNVLSIVAMNNSDYDSVNKIIEQLPIRTSDSMGRLYIEGVDDHKLVNKSEAKLKYWAIMTIFPNIKYYTLVNEAEETFAYPIFNSDESVLSNSSISVKPIENEGSDETVFCIEIEIQEDINSIQFVNPECLLKMLILDTSNMTTMKDLFKNCTQLNSIECSDWDTSNVTDMSDMFRGCSQLTQLDVNNWDTSNVQYMYGMFYDCSQLIQLYLTNWDISSVRDVNGMFVNCSSLTQLDVSTWDTKSVTNMNNMFYNCSLLTLIDVSTWDTKNVTDISGMFYNCTNLTTLDLSNFDTTNVTNMAAMFQNCTNLTSLDVSNFDTRKVTTMYNMFLECRSLTELNVSNWNVDSVTNINNMFNNSSISELDVSKWNTSNITTMEGTFANCKLLTELDTAKWNTGNVTNMSYIFQNCTNLTSLDLSNFNTSNVTTMAYMFYNCQSLTSLDLDNWDTSNVTDMRQMFKNCKSLIELDVTNWNVSNVTDMHSLFYNCQSLTSLNVSNWNINNVTNMNYIFGGCTLLSELDLNNFSLNPSMTEIKYLFYNCSSLIEIDLHKFNISNIGNFEGLFSECSSLINLNLNNWIINENANTDYLFDNCGISTISMNNSNYVSVNNVIAELPTRTSDSIGTLNITGIDDINQVNINDAKTKFWIINNSKKIKSIKINNKNINKIYKGLLKIKKIYLG